LSDSDVGSDDGDAETASVMSTDFDDIMNWNFAMDSESEAVDALMGGADDDDEDDDDIDDGDSS
jgi:hypothetical protein